MRNADLFADPALLGGGAVDGRVAGVHPGHQQPLVMGALVEGGDVLQRGGRRVDHQGVRSGAGHDALVDQAGGPDHDVGLGDHPSAAQGDQVGRTGPGPDEHHLALSSGIHSRPPVWVRAGAISTVEK